jgi:hypothetical protein
MTDRHEVIVQSGFRGLRYADGRFDEVLEPGRYELPQRRFLGKRVPRVSIVPIDVRELNIKGQEILTAALLRLRELETLGTLGTNAAARLYIGFDKHSDSVTAE